MLTGACLGDQPLFPHFFCEERLPKGVIDFMRARMREVLSFEIYLCAAQGLGQPLCKIKRRRPADIIFYEIGKFPLGILVLFELAIGIFKFVECRDKRLGRKTPAVRPEVASFIR
jgi:hypothetical protein